MPRTCEITGKRMRVGNNVAHSNARTKRRFNVNLQKKRFYIPSEDRWIRLTVSTSGIKYIDKVGIEKALKTAMEKGYYKPKK